MRTVVLGRKSPLTVSAVGLGCMGMVSSYPPIPDKKDMIRFAREAFEQGETFFDTAEVYGPYISEEILGEALHDVRNQVQIATKFGFDIQNGVSVGLDSRPETIRKAVEGSLRRLKTDHIDLLYQHRADPKVPVEAVAETVSRLMEEGKVLHWGMSEVSVRTIRKAHAILPLTAVQNEYSMWYRDVEKELLPVLDELGVGLVCFCPLGRGYLTGKLKQTVFPEQDVRGGMPRFSSKEALLANQELLDFLQTQAREKDCTMAQLALAWILAQRPWIVPIPGTTKLSRLKENIGAAHVKFTPAEMKMLNEKLSRIQIHGARYNAQQESMVEK
ncbi:MAG: aldo/keto reductase [Ruminococcus sp.]|jgi:aryl-alcohol dehydrogenase-like predicted oxidoreductase